MRVFPVVGCFSALLFFAPAAKAQVFQLPTTNHFLFEPDQYEKFFVGTAGKPWTSGMFGCVRSGGWQMHEGIDIRALQHDRRGEPLDAIRAAADGIVAYINPHSGLSNYGKYIVLRHAIEGIEVFSLYAHLSEVAPGLKAEKAVRGGEQIAVMGRTANTRQPITKDRAHLHFELNFLLNDRFSDWHKKEFRGGRNDHGNWNGRNLVALDPVRIFLAQRQQRENFRLLNAIRHETELCRVFVRKTGFSFLKRHAPLIKPNPVTEREGAAGYEIALTFNGLPFELIPRAASEIPGKGLYQLISVNPEEYRNRPCRRLVVPKNKGWVLGNNAVTLLDLLTY